MRRIASDFKGSKKASHQVSGQAIDTLFISSSFFGYYLEICKALTNRGRRVFWCEDRPSIDPLTKGIIRLKPDLLARASEGYFENIALQFSADDIKDVFVIKGEALTFRSLRFLRSRFHRARFTIYFWDSYKNMYPAASKKVEYFDRSFTFDLADAESDSRLVYRPLFFTQNRLGEIERGQRLVDISFVGTAHSDRYRVIQRLRKGLPDGLVFDSRLFFQSKALLAIRRILDPRLYGASFNDFIFAPMSRQDVRKLILESRACLDIERTIQTGFAPRTLEIIGLGRKLITTNANVKNADFYNENNVLIIDRLKPTVSRAFLDSPYIELTPEVRRKYTIETWLDDVLGT